MEHLNGGKTFSGGRITHQAAMAKLDCLLAHPQLSTGSTTVPDYFCYFYSGTLGNISLLLQATCFSSSRIV